VSDEKTLGEILADLQKAPETFAAGLTGSSLTTRILRDALTESRGFGAFAASVRAVLRHAVPSAYRYMSLDHSPSLEVCGRCPCRDCVKHR
jgi:hypothetical protein